MKIEMKHTSNEENDIDVFSKDSQDNIIFDLKKDVKHDVRIEWNQAYQDQRISDNSSRKTMLEVELLMELCGKRTFILSPEVQRESAT